MTVMRDMGVGRSAVPMGLDFSFFLCVPGTHVPWFFHACGKTPA